MRARILIIIYLLLPAYLVTAQYPILRNYSVEDGLPSSNVYFTTEDSKGFMWIGTDMGVSRFDGYEFKTFTVEHGLPSNDVWRIEEDEFGRMWLSTFNQIAYIKGEEVGQLPLPRDVESSSVVVDNYIDEYFNHTIFLNNRLYFRNAHDSLIRISRKSLVHIPREIAMKEDSTNHWFFNNYRRNAGISETSPLLYFNEKYFSNKDNWLFQAIQGLYDENALEGSEINLFSAEQDWYLYMYTKKVGLLKLDAQNQTIEKIDQLRGIDIIYGEYLSYDKILIKTQSSSFFVVNDQLEVLPQFDFLDGLKVNTASLDRHQNFWTNTNDGIFFLSGNAINSKHYPLTTENTSQEVVTMALDNDKRLWLGGANGHLYVFENETLPKMCYAHLMKTHYKAIEVDQHNTLYIGGDFLYVVPAEQLLNPSASLRLQPRRVGIDTNRNKRLPRAIKDILLHENQIQWSSYNDLYFEETEGQVQFLRGINYRYIYALEIDDKGINWIGKKSGVGQLSDTGYVALSHLNPLFAKPVNDLKSNKQGLWVGTDGYGLFCYHNEVIDTIAELRNEIIKSIYIDKKDRIWAATNRGIGKITPHQDTAFSYSFQRITTAHGLSTNEVNQVLLDSNTIYVATKRGLSVLDDNELNAYKHKPPLYFTNCSINNRDTIIQDYFDLEYYQRNITIEFVCLSFESQGNITYEYKMEGVDQNWQETTSRRKEYPLLPPGRYKFNLNARGINGNLAAGPIVMTFIIRAPWWQTMTFRFGALLAFMLIVTSIAQYRIKQIRKKAEEQNKIEKKFAELELKALQAQMNPHFVFNALHSIQDFIFNKNERIANAYLVKFSRLMRLFLESSKEKFILLEDEIKLLQLYIDLEKLRFQEKFDYTIEIDPLIEPKLIEIPSMLFQPFVENAINHGLIYKESKGLLHISIKKEKDCIRCIIQDDGIGRKKAAELKKDSYKSYKSRGMKLVEERQRVMNFISDSEIQIDIHDLKNDQQEDAGTKVIIDIPFFE